MRLQVFAVAAAFLFATTAAHADDLFTYVKDIRTIKFTLPDSPTPSLSFSGDEFILNNVPYTLNGVAGTDDFTFYNKLDSGGFTGGTFDEAGAQLYSGTEANPTFLLGTYTLTQGGVQGTLTIADSNPAAAVTPEPSSFALLGTGIIGLIGIARRRFA